MSTTADIAIIGGGIAGLSLAAAIGERLTVVDGVPLRERAVPASRHVVHPETGEPGVQVVVEASDGRVLGCRSVPAPAPDAQRGGDDDGRCGDGRSAHVGEPLTWVVVVRGEGWRSWGPQLPPQPQTLSATGTTGDVA